MALLIGEVVANVRWEYLAKLCGIADEKGQSELIGFIISCGEYVLRKK